MGGLYIIINTATRLNQNLMGLVAFHFLA